MGLTCNDDDPQAKVEPSSLATPRSFSLSESDGKSKHFKKSVSYKKVSFTNLRLPISHSFNEFFLDGFFFFFSIFVFSSLYLKYYVLLSAHVLFLYLTIIIILILNFGKKKIRHLCDNFSCCPEEGKFVEDG